MIDPHESAAQTAPLFGRLLLLLDPEPHDAALNMALDDVLLHRAAHTPLLRCYRWVRPAVSLGYFGRYAEAAAAWTERDNVRRWTGGGIAPHGDDFTCALIVPRACPFFKGPRRTRIAPFTSASHRCSPRPAAPSRSPSHPRR